MSDGWFATHRSLLHHDLWLAEKFTRGQAWVDLIGLANHSGGMICVRGMDIPIKRGQVGWSEVSLAERWKWSRGKVRRYLDSLRKRKMVSQQTSNKTSVVTVLNYDRYQFGCIPSGTANRTVNGTTNGQQTDTNKKDKKEKKERIKDEGGGSPPVKKKQVDPFDEQARLVLDHLNSVTGKRFKVTGYIPARLRAGATVEECKRVIDFKAKDKDFDKKYLDHTTPFREGNFDRYLNQTIKDSDLKNGGNSDEGNTARGWQADPENRWSREVDKACEG